MFFDLFLCLKGPVRAAVSGSSRLETLLHLHFYVSTTVFSNSI
jgi:hypothetical protein